MADVDAAIDYTLTWEDPKLTGVITLNDDGVTHTRFGIDERFHPELVACGFYKDMGSTVALAVARNVYAESYATPLSIAEMGNQEVANKVLSLGVNEGIRVAAKMLQLAVNVPCDGSIGPLTLFALASADPAKVHESIDDQAIAYYHEKVVQNPAKQKYLNGWIARATAV